MVIDNIILFISIVNFILTLFVFLNAKELKQHASFLIFSFITTIWLFDNFLLRIYPNSINGSLSYGLGVLVGTAGLLWVYNLIEEKFPKFVLYFIVPFSVLVFFIVSFTHYVVLRFSVLGTFGFVGGQKGILFVEYSLYVGFLLLICLYNLAKKSLQEKDDLKRKRIRLIFIGCLIFGLTVVVVDFLMPIFFNSFEVIYLDNITFFLFLMFVIYSMVKHDLFGIKIMLAQFLVGIFLSLLFLNFLLSGTLTGYMWNGALLLVSMFLSYLIMKSIFREIKVHKALLETAQRNLDAEQKLRKDFVEISQKAIYKIEKEI